MRTHIDSAADGAVGFDFTWARPGAMGDLIGDLQRIRAELGETGSGEAIEVAADVLGHVADGLREFLDAAVAGGGRPSAAEQ